MLVFFLGWILVVRDVIAKDCIVAFRCLSSVLPWVLGRTQQSVTSLMRVGYHPIMFVQNTNVPRRRGKVSSRISQEAMSPVQKWFESQDYEVESEGGFGGSSWSSNRTVKTSKEEFLVKTSPRPASAMFEGEALGLQSLGAAGGVRVPVVLHYGDDDKCGSFIIMEQFDLGGRLDMREFGMAMVTMHLAKPIDMEANAGKFGFVVHNTIGGSPQRNPWTADWPDFCSGASPRVSGATCRQWALERHLETFG